MRMIEIDYEAQPPIDGYGPGGFRVAGNWHARRDDLDGGRAAADARRGHSLTTSGTRHCKLPSDLDLVVIGQGDRDRTNSTRFTQCPGRSRHRDRDHGDTVGLSHLQCSADRGQAGRRGTGACGRLTSGDG